MPRKRSKPIQFYVTEQEKKNIENNATAAGVNNVGDYLRKMAIDGYIIKVDYENIKELIQQVRKIGININQTTKRINENSTVYEADIKEIKEREDQIWQLLRYTLLNLH